MSTEIGRHCPLVNCLHVFQVGSDRWGSAGCLLDARLGRRPVAVCPAPSHWSCSLALHWRARGRSPSRFLAGPASRATTAFHQPTIIPLFQLGSLPLLHARPDFFYLTPCLPRTSRSFITFMTSYPLRQRHLAELQRWRTSPSSESPRWVVRASSLSAIAGLKR